MSSLFIFGYPPKTSIQLETSKKTQIDNYQVFELSTFERNQFADYSNTRYSSMRERTNPSPQYNCHGMTFASRRTNIDSATEILKILADDGYQLITIPLVLPGDLLLYKSQNGDIAHSATVVASEQPSNDLPRITVVSKWGKYREIIHAYRDCPYIESGNLLEFYRLNHDY